MHDVLQIDQLLHELKERGHHANTIALKTARGWLIPGQTFQRYGITKIQC
jgi:hypothetical protein